MPRVGRYGSAAMRVGRVALTVALGAGFSAAQQPPPLPSFRADVGLFRLAVTARDGDDRLVTDLAAEDFAVFVAGRRAPIAGFAQDSHPLALAVVSVGGSSANFARLRTTVRALADALGPRDRMVIGSTRESELGFTPFLTSDPRVLHRVVNEELWWGQGGFWTVNDAIRVGMEQVAREPARRAVIVIGRLPESRCPKPPILIWSRPRTLPCVTADEVLKSGRQHAISIYAIDLQPGPDAPVRALTRATGGGYRRPAAGDNPAQLATDVLHELRYEYVLGVPRDGNTSATVDVRPTRRGIVLHSRQVQSSKP